MSDNQNPEAPKLTRGRIAQFVIGIVLFGVLMGIRNEFASAWFRMLVAGCAGAVLGIVVLRLWKYR